jgi:hypothetical protein
MDNLMRGAQGVRRVGFAAFLVGCVRVTSAGENNIPRAVRRTRLIDSFSKIPVQGSTECPRVCSRLILLAAFLGSAVTSVACTKYTVAPEDGGGDGSASGGTAGAVTTALGGSGGTVTGVDGSIRDTAVPLLANGATCRTEAECQFGNCVDSVCCESACASQCQSCSEPTLLGKCVTVSGAVRGKVRAACAGTGTCVSSCNGSDPIQCHYPGAEKQCAPASCAAKVAKFAASCDGVGNCPPVSTGACDPFVCGPTACKTMCVTTADCTASNYCAAPNCVPQKALGSVCATFAECTTGICGGRCCMAPCTCPQPSPQNLFQNAGFDSNVSSWDSIKGVGTTGIQWSSQDVDGCPFSGSVQVLSGLGNPSQCVAVTPGASYTFGGWFRNLDGNAYTCALSVWSGPNCTGTTGASANLSGSETIWTFRTFPLDVPANDVSLKIICEANQNTFIDKLSLSTTGTF